MSYSFFLARCLLFTAICAAAFSGCSGSGLATVTGTVTVDGKPLEQGTIIFETPGARQATGRIEAGKIVSVGTNTENDGVPVGAHKVAIQAVEASTASAATSTPGDASAKSLSSMSSKSLLPARYGDPNTSGLTAEIKAGENEVTFALESR